MFAFGFVGQLVLPLDLRCAALVRTLHLARGVCDVARGTFSSLRMALDSSPFRTLDILRSSATDTLRRDIKATHW